MFTVNIPPMEFFDEATSEFMYTKGGTLSLEHSLISLSKWESKWHKPFLSETEKTHEEILDYVRCMTIGRVEDDLVYESISEADLQRIGEYINDPMTATWFNDREKGHISREVVTAEIIYYWMVSLEIPFECEKWHLNRLLTLIRVCNAKNAPKQKMSTKDIYKQNSTLNKARKAKYGTKG